MLCNANYEIECRRMQLGIFSDREIFKNFVDCNTNSYIDEFDCFSDSGELEEELVGVGI